MAIQVDYDFTQAFSIDGSDVVTGNVIQAGPDLQWTDRGSGARMFDASGSLVWGPENLCKQSETLSTSPWTLIGSSTWSAGTMSLSGSDSIFQVAQIGSGYGQALDLRVEVKQISSSGTLRISNGGIPDGYWKVDVASLSTDWEWIDENHAAVTVVNAWKANSAAGDVGLLFRDDNGVGFDVGVRKVHQQRKANANRTFYMPTTTAFRYAPRLSAHHYDGSSWVDRGYLVERAVTNECLDSTDLESGTAWTDNQNQWGTAQSNNGISLEYLQADSTTNSNHSVYQDVSSIADNGRVIFSAIVKDAGDGLGFVQLHVTKKDGTTDKETFNLSTGAAGASGTFDAAGVIDLGSSVYRVWGRTNDMSTGGTTPRFQIYLAEGDDDITLGGNQNGNGIYVGAPQVEEVNANVDKPSSYIPSGASALTRSADKLKVTDWGNNVTNWSATTGSFYFQGWLTHQKDNRDWFEVGTADELRMHNNAATDIEILEATNARDTNNTPAADEITRIAFALDAGTPELRYSRNGTGITALTYSNDTTIVGTDDLYFGGTQTANNEFDDFITEFHWYDTALSQANLNTLSSTGSLPTAIPIFMHHYMHNIGSNV